MADIALGRPGLAEKMLVAPCSLCLIPTNVTYRLIMFILSATHTATSISLFPQGIHFWQPVVVSKLVAYTHTGQEMGLGITLVSHRSQRAPSLGHPLV